MEQDDQAGGGRKKTKTEQVHKVESLWFSTQLATHQFQNSNTRLGPNELRQDVIALAEHTARAIVALSQIAEKTETSVEVLTASVQQHQAATRNDLDTLELRTRTMMGDMGKLGQQSQQQVPLLLLLGRQCLPRRVCMGKLAFPRDVQCMQHWHSCIVA